MLQNQSAHLEVALDILGKGPHHPSFDDAWEYLAMCPDPTIQLAMRQAVEEAFGPYPKPIGYSDDQEPFWDVDEIARYLGIAAEELIETARDVEEKWTGRTVMKDSSELHLLH
ncbi:MAG: hypothetical protein HQL78_06240 [Magnetococcales bacterium]|nr:hypothetical protein [Magnetococcales bacterium]MBF0419749.1 hypothetical protein [Magnetococcales bacterium]